MMNKIILMGRPTTDIEIKYTTTNKKVVSFTLAVNQKEQANFFPVVAWETKAEFLSNYVKKGQLICIEGRLQNHNYEKDGVKHYTNEIILENCYFADSNKNKTQPQENDGWTIVNDEEGLPF